MTKTKQEKKTRQSEAILRVHPFPTLIAQAIQLADLAGREVPGDVQVFTKAALVFTAMSLECAATSCLELAMLPDSPQGKIDRALGVLDKFDMLQWLSTHTPLDRGQCVVQKVQDLVDARNQLVHARVKRESFGPVRHYVVGAAFEAPHDKSLWNALRIPKNERSWSGEHAKLAIKAAVEFLNYFFFDACKLEQKAVVPMLSTSSGTAVAFTPWERQVLGGTEQRFGLKLRFLGF